MSFVEKLNADMKQAMKSKEKQKLNVIRSLKSALQNEELEKGSSLSDEDTLTVVSREVKQKNESLQEFEKAGRTDLVEKTKQELAILQAYMPEQLSEDELTELVRETIEQLGASSKADMGKVMGAIMPKVKGRANGTLVNQIVQNELT